MQPGCEALVSPSSDRDVCVRLNLASAIGQRQYDHWFRDKTRLVLDGPELVVYAASPFLLKWLQKQYRGALMQAAEAVIGPAARVRFDVGARETGAPHLGLVAASASDAAPQAVVDSATPESTPAPVIAVPPEPSASAQPRERTAGRRFADLAEFVAGNCNAMALTAVRQVCDRPDGGSGSLVLYGPVGTGKSHLLEGIYRQLRRCHPEMNTIFLTSEQFTNYFTQAYREHTLPAFRQRFRTVDALLVDDVDFFDGKRVVQEEFLHTFKQLASWGKLIVVCADRHPRLLAKVCDELKTRFLSGMVCRLEAPDLETRLRIVERKAARLDADFSTEALRYVAQRFANSVRELEGALNSLKVYHQMTGRRIGITVARQVLSDLERDCLRVVRLADIERVVCDLFGVDADDLRSPRRTRAVSEPRMLAMYLARRHTRSAYSEIGQHFGGRNHATVIAAERKVAEWLKQGVSVRVASRTWQMGDILETLEQQLLAG